MSRAMKKARILSSESDASIKVKQCQDTTINLHIAPPSQSVNFQPSPMAELATMVPPARLKASTFSMIAEEEPLVHPLTVQHLQSVPITPAIKECALIQTDGPSVQACEPATTRQPQSQEEIDIGCDCNESINEAVLDGPFIATSPNSSIIDSVEPNRENDISIIDELKRPMDILPPQTSANNQARLRGILDEKTKRANILECMLEIYENTHHIVNGLLTCRRPQLERIVRAYTNADGVELMLEPIGCGCFASGPKLLPIESIIVTIHGKAFDFRCGFNDAYADMSRHGINLKQIIA